MDYPHAKHELVSVRMRRNTKTDTKPERLLRSALHTRGLRFRKNFLIRLDGGSVRPDIVFARQKIAVFVDGCFWHRCPQHGTSPRFNSSYWQAKLDRNAHRDREVDAALIAAGWMPIRIWEHEAVSSAAQRVLEIVSGAHSKSASSR
jgi:DNA mismatch endonuclease (patch repair protein)